MLTWEDDIDIQALRRQGWTISAIARHTGRDRKTVRTYLARTRTPGVRARPTDPFDAFVDYVSARLAEDPHLWALTLFDELQRLGFSLSYPSLTRQIRARRLRPDCLGCRGATGRVNAVIDHLPGEETRWDWLDLPDPGRVGMGQDCASAGRVPGPLWPVAGRARPGDGPAAPG